MSKPLTILYEFGSFRLDTVNRLLFHKDDVLPLTSKAVEILLLLLEDAGSVVEKDELMSRVWPDNFVEETNLAHHVYLLRKALGDATNENRFIQTVPKRGYRFVAQVKKTANRRKTERSDASEIWPPSRDELSQSLPNGDSGSPRSSVDILATSEPFNGDIYKSSETSAGQSERQLAHLTEDSGLLSVSHETPEPKADGRPPASKPLQLIRRPTTRLVQREPLIRARMKRLAGHWTIWTPVMTGMALLIGIIWLNSNQNSARKHERQVKTSPFTTMPGMENQPTFSPDGNQVAFCWNGENQDNFDIYVKLIGTESLLRLTTDPAQDTSPAFSPDGRFVAFRRNTGENSGFYIVPALGGVERKIAAAFATRADHVGRSIDWTPDGKFLVIIDRESEKAGFNISVLSVDTGQKRLLIVPVPQSVGVMGVAVSPDGNTVAFSQVSPKRGDVGSLQSDLYTVSFLGGEPKQLT